MKKIEITSYVESSEIAEMVTNSIQDHEELLQFILEIDLTVADLDFTIKLRDMLSDAINQEVGSD